MDWKEVLAKVRLIDITPKVEGKQVGGINVNVENKTENKTYNFNFYNKEAAEVFVAGNFKFTEEFEKKVKQEAERRLTTLGISPDLLSETARTEIASVTTASSAVYVSKVGETLKLSEKVTVKLSPESEPEK